MEEAKYASERGIQRPNNEIRSLLPNSKSFFWLLIENKTVCWMRAESSVVSACSRSSVSRSQLDELHKASTSKFDRIFPMIDEMLKLVELPTFVYYLIVIYVMMQVYSVSLWPGFASLKTQCTIEDSIVSWFLDISFITDKDTAASYQLSLIIVAVITVITILVFSLELIVYSKIRRFTTWSLYAVRFFLELVLTIPIANYLRRLFLSLIHI